MLLEEEGHTPFTFAIGADALAYLRQQTRPHVVITDYLMPSMMGDEFLQQAFDECPDVPHRYVLFAARPVSKLPPEVQSFLENNHIPFLQKPFVLEDILKYVSTPLP
jgi:CheY-like chemotaxis protein